MEKKEYHGVGEGAMGRGGGGGGGVGTRVEQTTELMVVKWQRKTIAFDKDMKPAAVVGTDHCSRQFLVSSDALSGCCDQFCCVRQCCICPPDFNWCCSPK